MTADPKDARDRAEDRFEETLPMRGYRSSRRIAVALLTIVVIVAAGLLAFN